MASVGSSFTYIQNCDSILETMETMLGQFQSDLGNISGEIQSLQEQSLSMNVKLKNRKSVQVSLTDFVEGMSVSPELVDKIANSEVDSSFLREISKVDVKLDYVSKQPDDMPATAEAQAELQAIVTRAAERLQEAMLQKIHAVRKPMSNLQVQQGTLVGFCDGFQFLSKHSRETAAEIKAEYIETFSKVHWSYFKTYVGRLMKLQFDELTLLTPLSLLSRVLRDSTSYCFFPHIKGIHALTGLTS